MDFSKATILVTGGNSGIGRGLAQALSAQGAEIIITGRNSVSLAETLAANPAMTGYQLDVSVPDDVRRFVAMLVERHPSLNALINNAGMMATEKVLDPSYDPELAERIVATNLIAPIRLTTALIPHFQLRDEAAFIMVSSALGFVPRGDAPTYGATKAALHSWTIGLRHQLQNTNISVIEIVPPLVATNFSPGQAENPRAMPLDAFVSEAVELLSADETPSEVLVERVVPQRNAERSGRFDEIFKMINPT